MENKLPDSPGLWRRTRGKTSRIYIEFVEIDGRLVDFNNHHEPSTWHVAGDVWDRIGDIPPLPPKPVEPKRLNGKTADGVFVLVRAEKDGVSLFTGAESVFFYYPLRAVITEWLDEKEPTCSK